MHWLIVNIICLICFGIQFGNVLEGYIFPVQTNTQVGTTNLQDIQFPIIFKICVKPGFNLTAIEESGYSSLWTYFSGQSSFNESVYGWAGHTMEGVVASPADMLARARAHAVEDVLEDISFWSDNNQMVEVSLDSVKLWRMNYPHNCYTLDLTNHTAVKEEGVKQLFLTFPLLANSSMEMVVQGSSLACSRDIKYHKFYSSGPDIALEDLGEFITPISLLKCCCYHMVAMFLCHH